jgi:hypothetical protein
LEDNPVSTSYARMIESGQIKDPIPKIQAAGKSTAVFDDSAAKDLQSEIFFPLPPTPRTLQRFRRNYDPGAINHHWGYHDNKLPAKGFAYGVKGNQGSSAAACLAAGKKEGIAEYVQMRGEQIYASTKREPLGVAIDRGYNLPKAITEDPEFKYGRVFKDSNQIEGKLVLFPRGVKPDDVDTHDRYVKTHGSFDPGEMIDRKYRWPADPKNGEQLDPANFAFGLKDPLGSADTAKSALTMDRNADDTYPATRIVPLTAEAYREVACDPLGRAKNDMQGTQPLPPDHAYGIKCVGSDTTVGDILRGWYTREEQMAEYDLGRSMKVGRRNVPPPGNRAFGVPSVRTDKPKPKTRSCADTSNYGDEAGASALLHPQRFELMGVPDEEFLLRRDREELQSILTCAGIAIPHFDTIFDTACQLFEDGDKVVSLDAYLYVHSELVNEDVAEKEGAIREPRVIHPGRR